MKIILVGASGTIGQAIEQELRARHDIIRVGRNSGDLQADITDPASIRHLFERAGAFDALISAAGKVHFGALAEMGEAEFEVPADSMHSFAASNNQIVWTLNVQGDIPWWPDVSLSFPITVTPHEHPADSHA